MERINLLMVEDSDDDAILVERELQRAGYELNRTRVDSAGRLRDALGAGEWHIVITDYNLPQFNGMDALKIVQESGRDIPVVVVSGTVGEETAAAVMKAGAGNFVLKNRLSRLGPIVARELREADERRARRRLEEQVRQKQKMEAIGHLAGGVAHDFNNLLTIILGRGELLLKRLAADNPVRREISMIQDAAERAAGLTRQLLQFSRQQAVQPKVVSINTIIQDISGMLRRLIGEHIEFSTALEPALPSILADPSQLQQIIMNLCVNARDAMPQGGRLIIETRSTELDEQYARQHESVKPGRYALITVSDTGAGMDTATQSRLFEPFFTTKEVGKGTGLGLSTVYGIVKQCNGHIYVYSEPGKGTVFKIYLPVTGESLTVAASSNAMPAVSADIRTVLLVEDEDAVRELVSEVLKTAGFSVLTAADGEAAMKLAKSFRDDLQLLLTDVVMPKMSGDALAKEIALICPKIRVLYMSGYSRNALGRQGGMAEDIFYLEKPFTPDKLLRRVREVLTG